MKIFLLSAATLVLSISALTVSGQETLVMGIEDVFKINGVGTMVSGTVESGEVKTGMKVEIKGVFDSTYQLTVGLIDKDRKKINTAVKGDKVLINVRGNGAESVKRGMLLSEPGKVKAWSEIELTVKFRNTADGGLSEPLKQDQPFRIINRTDWSSGKVVLADGQTGIKPGATGVVRIRMRNLTPFLLNDKVTLQSGSTIIGEGTVTKLLK